MKIFGTDLQITDQNYALLGPTFAYAPTKNAPQYGSLLMCASVSDGSDSGVGNMLWRSNDEGLTWEKEGFIERSFQYDRQGSMVKVGGNAALYTDPDANVILFTSNEMYWSENNFDSTRRCSRPFYRLSFDNGRTWSDKHYIVTEGHTLDNPIPDVVFGRNFSLSMASQTLAADDGSLLVALQCQMTDEKGDLYEPSGFHFFQSGALHAKWEEATLRYVWRMSDYVRVTESESMRGVFEPTFARIGDHRILMILRNSNYGNEHGVIGRKFYAVSDDSGYTWSRPKPLTYGDGSTMYTASSVPKVLHHSNGTLYYIGVINETNPTGNNPRFPLCIAEIDPDTCTVRKETVTVIDTQRDGCSDYSNHGVFEDSQGRIIVYTPFGKRGLNRYEIVL